MKNNKDIEKICAFCECARSTHDEDFFVCSKRGIVHAEYKCARFIYDPMKRIAKRPPSVENGFEYVDLNPKN